MQIVNLTQGSPEWHAHRATHFNASDAPAMLGISPHMSREELLKRMATGIAPEITPQQQYIFGLGHDIEAACRPHAEEIIGETLAPIVGAEGKLSASFDGITFDGSTIWECKTMNNELRSVFASGNPLPDRYLAQIEQQFMVSGAEKCLFNAATIFQNGELDEVDGRWIEPNPAMRQRIIGGWAQFEIDLANYVPPVAAEVIVAKAVTDLPAVFAQVSGSIAIKDNMPAFEVALRDFIDNQLIRHPETDQDFADLELQIKALKKAEAALDALEEQAITQFEALDFLKKSKEMLYKLSRDNRLAAEKLSAARKEQIKLEQVQRGRAELATHIEALNTRLGKPWMPMQTINADFAGAIKGKRTVESLKSAVNDTLASAKIAANEVADLIQVNLATLDKLAHDHGFLFSDAQSLVQKSNDDFALLVKSRIAEHQAKEQARLDAERDRIRTEEEAKAREAVEREAKAAQARAQAEAVAKLNNQEMRPAVSSEPVHFDSQAVKESLTPEEDDGSRINISQINARLAPISLTARGIAELGIAGEPSGKSTLYSNAEFLQICRALIGHIKQVGVSQKSALEAA